MHRAQWGHTHVLACTTSELVSPNPDKPIEGFLNFSVDASRMCKHTNDTNDAHARANTSDGTHHSDDMRTELLKVIDRNIRRSNAIDCESLCVVSGERVWSIETHITVLNNDGNLIDACMLAVMAALKHFRKPHVTVLSEVAVGEEDATATVSSRGGGEGASKAKKRRKVSAAENADMQPSRRVIVHHGDEKDAVPLPVHHTPLSITMGLLKCTCFAVLYPPYCACRFLSVATHAAPRRTRRSCPR